MGESNKTRLKPSTFDIAVQEIRRGGYYSAAYFLREKCILEDIGYNVGVLMQVFQKNHAVICGTDEAIAVIKLCSGRYKTQSHFSLFDKLIDLKQKIRELSSERKFTALETAQRQRLELELALDQEWQDCSGELQISALFDGDMVNPWETVMTIVGLPQHFAHLESVYLGILARRTLVATNVHRVVEAAKGKPIMFFADRFDHYTTQTGDGYAAKCGGLNMVATDSMGEWWGSKGIGSMPHALIACFNGDTVKASIAFAKRYPNNPCISLVDFHNDCPKTALEVADAFSAEGLKLWGVRLDTSENIVDASIVRHDQMGNFKPTGVNPVLVNNVRLLLDRTGHDDVKILVSGGFDEAKIRHFESLGVPVDAYGCGSSLLKGSNDFTADIVRVNGQPCSKVGRVFRQNDRLRLA